MRTGRSLTVCRGDLPSTGGFSQLGGGSLPGGFSMLGGFPARGISLPGGSPCPEGVLPAWGISLPRGGLPAWVSPYLGGSPCPGVSPCLGGSPCPGGSPCLGGSPCWRPPLWTESQTPVKTSLRPVKMLEEQWKHGCRMKMNGPKRGSWNFSTGMVLIFTDFPIAMCIVKNQ